MIQMKRIIHVEEIQIHYNYRIQMQYNITIPTNICGCISASEARTTLAFCPPDKSRILIK